MLRVTLNSNNKRKIFNLEAIGLIINPSNVTDMALLFQDNLTMAITLGSK